MLTESVITFILTVIGGVLIYTFGQFGLKFFIEPIHRLAKARGEIAYFLSFYAEWYCNPKVMSDEKREEVKDVFRSRAASLMSSLNMIHWYGTWRRLRILPTAENIREASKDLVGLSNSLNPYHDVHSGINLGRENWERRRSIEKLLNIKVPE